MANVRRAHDGARGAGVSGRRSVHAGAGIVGTGGSHYHCYAEECRGDGGGVLIGAFVLGVEQRIEFAVEVGRSAGGFGGGVGVHRGAVILSEVREHVRRLSGRVERVRVLGEGDIFFPDAGGGEAIDDVVFDSPRHRADESVRRRRGVGGADLENLRDERGIAGDPVAHDDAPAGLGDAHHFFGDVHRPRGEHRAEDAHDEIEGVIFQILKIAGVALLELAVGEPELRGAAITGVDQVLRDIDTENIRAELRRGDGGGAVAAAEIEDSSPW
jgi:hypothetical protein